MSFTIFKMSLATFKMSFGVFFKMSFSQNARKKSLLYHKFWLNSCFNLENCLALLVRSFVQAFFCAIWPKLILKKMPKLILKVAKLILKIAKLISTNLKTHFYGIFVYCWSIFDLICKCESTKNAYIFVTTALNNKEIIFLSPKLISLRPKLISLPQKPIFIMVKLSPKG